jgi:hypothetical protein
MFTLILSLIQAQPARIPTLVWVGAILVLLIGVSLLVYFFSRLKKGEKESEEDWSLARRSLFVEPSQPVEAGSTEVVSTIESEPLDQEEAPLLGSSVAPTPAENLADDLKAEPVPTEEVELPPTVVMEPPAPEPVAAEPPTIEAAREEPPPAPEPPAEERATELLVSSPGSEEPHEAEVFGEDVWSELEHSPAEVIRDEPRDARVGHRLGREPFDPPTIRPLVGRQQFEAPRIDQLVASGNQAPELHREAALPLPTEPSQPQTDFIPEPFTQPSAVSPAAAGTKGASPHRKPAGTVLGLPVESSHSPLVLGEPSRPSAEAGIGALTNYGKETGPEAGWGGTIVLLLTILLVGGGVVSYLYVPYVHGKVDSIVARLRPPPPAETPAPETTGVRAQVFPARSEADKNIVKARGTIYNTSSKPLEGLAVEVALERGGGAPPDTRVIEVIPSRLEPRQQGRYEFQYDGSQASGYPSGYRVTKLLSSEGEVKFAAAGQPRTQ